MACGLCLFIANYLPAGSLEPIVSSSYIQMITDGICQIKESPDDEPLTLGFHWQVETNIFKPFDIPLNTETIGGDEQLPHSASISSYTGMEYNQLSDREYELVFQGSAFGSLVHDRGYDFTSAAFSVSSFIFMGTDFTVMGLAGQNPGDPVTINVNFDLDGTFSPSLFENRDDSGNASNETTVIAGHISNPELDYFKAINFPDSPIDYQTETIDTFVGDTIGLHVRFLCAAEGDLLPNDVLSQMQATSDFNMPEPGLRLNITVIPEPAGSLLLAGGLCALTIRYRKPGKA